MPVIIWIRALIGICPYCAIWFSTSFWLVR
jgi:hypothetical protein